MMQQEHNDPKRDPDGNSANVKIGLTKSEREALEKRLGDHADIADFFRHVVQQTMDGVLKAPVKFGARPAGFRKQLKVSVSPVMRGWIRTSAKIHAATMTDFLIAAMMTIPETPRSTNIKRVSRNKRITTEAGRIEMKQIFIGGLLLDLQQLFQETFTFVDANQATEYLVRIAEASEAIARGEGFAGEASEHCSNTGEVA